MKPVTWSLFYAVIGALFLCVGVYQNVPFFLLTGFCWFVLAAGEAWASTRNRKKKETWRPSMSFAFLLIAACCVYQGVTEPTGSNVCMAAAWAGAAIAYAVKAVRQFRNARAGREDS